MKSKNLINGDIFHVHRVGRLNIIKSSVLLNLIYRVNLIATRIPASHVVDVGKLILKFTWRGKKPKIDDTILKEKNEVGGLIVLDFKT